MTKPSRVREPVQVYLDPRDRALLDAMAVREAEEIAAIADDMFVPSSVSAALRRLKDGGR